MDTTVTPLLVLLAAGMAALGLGVAVYAALWTAAMVYSWQTTRCEEHALRLVRARKRRRAEFRRLIELMESGAPAPRLTDIG